ncbi:MAG: FlgD immunoglobulin-like domain containing protein, partial [Candidatus Poribacteria bacterium]
VFGLNWIAWRWNTSANRWEVPQSYRIFPVSSDAFDISVGWWVMVFGDGSVRSVNIPGTSVDCQNPYSITLKAGWNNVANPFDFAVAWADNTVRIEYNEQQVTPTQSKANLWVDNRTFWYDYATNQYNIMVSNQNPPYSMPPKVGFWLYSLVNNAKLIIYPIESIFASPPSPFVHNEEKSIWKVSLSLNTDEGSDNVEAIVSDKNCTGINYIKPPSMPFVSTRISIIDPNDNIEHSKGISQAKEQILWHIKVNTSSSGRLIWKMENVPLNYNLILEDSLTSKVYDLKQINSIDIIGENYTHYFILKAFKQDIPSKTRVLPNYPNPFNPETWIPFELSKPANVIIKIFSSDGRLIRTLDLGNKPAGSYITKDRSAYWDGKDEFGEYVSSGIYFYITKIGNVESVRKMAVIK